jgi:hypothetical protein
VKPTARIVLGFAACPVLPLIVRDAISHPSTLIIPLGTYFALVCIVYFIALLFGVALGLPLLLVLVHKRWITKTSFAVVGFVVGGALAFMAPSVTDSRIYDIVAAGLASAVSGLLLFMILYGSNGQSKKTIVG